MGFVVEERCCCQMQQYFVFKGLRKINLYTVIKKCYIILCCFLSGFSLKAQNIPPGYYNSASGLNCQNLKTALNNIITTGQVALSYGQLDNNQIPVVDTIRTDDGSGSMIWDIYSNNNTGPEPYFFNSSQVTPGGFCGGTTPTVDGTCWNKEHTFPRSWFANGGTYPSPTYADLFIVRPTDYRLNAKRASYPYATVASPTYQFPVAGTYPGYPMPANPVLDKLGPSSAAGVNIPIAWEPADAVKGDLARSYFYVLTRYENELSGWLGLNTGTGIEKVVDATNTVYPSFNLPYLTMMFNWHIADPADAKEINRNDLIYTQQGNRNPYIDHPEYAAQVWQCTGVIPVTITDFAAQRIDESVFLKWNATYETSFRQFEIERSTDGLNFNKIGNVEGRNLSSYSFTDPLIPNRPVLYYRLKMLDIDGKFTYSKTVTIKVSNYFSNALVYPNPTSGTLTIKLLEQLKENSLLQVLDITGRNVKHEMIRNGSLNISLNVTSLPEGRYFIRIANSQQLINESFIIIK